MNIRKYIATSLYVLLTLCNSFARWYVYSKNITSPSYVKLYGLIPCFLPYLAYKINYKSKWFFYIFVHVFALIYVYIFESANVIHFYNSLLIFSNMILRYNLYWKYVVYNTVYYKDSTNFHIFASSSYFAYFSDTQLRRFMTFITIQPEFVFYGCICAYLIIGLVGHMYYNVDEKHILMYDVVNYKRAYMQSSTVYFNTLALYSALRLYTNDDVHIAAIIGSWIVLTLNGKLLEWFSTEKLRYVSASLTLICILFMQYFPYYANTIKYGGISILIGCKYIIFDSVHQILHITHKKNVIDRYIGLEIIAQSFAHVCVYFIPQGLLLYAVLASCIFQYLNERYILKYYKKDSDFLECISQLEMF